MPRVHSSVDGRKLLVERVAASRCIGKSARLRELLVYLCGQVLEHGVHEIHEQEVGNAVFGRPPDYDTISDNIVRVYASMLRKRLEQYFSSEGRDEAVIVELPKGNYAPIFSERRVTEPVEPPVQAAAPPPERIIARPASWVIWGMATVAGVFAIVSFFLLIRGKNVPSAPTLIRGKSPVREFWSQIFAPGMKTDVVVDDEGVGLYQELTGTRVALSDYFNRNYLRGLTDKASTNKLERSIAGSIVLKRQSSYATTSLLWKIRGMASEMNGDGDVHFARDYSFRELTADNAFLIGTSLSNPWIESFESRLGLRW
ncbi:MAG: hypothetical protein JO091_07600, partial [Acidobacteriaceae bacterium]|nr:hypothetical protein [Acidobacteriaceae bacterium]